ncbi:unnamed protein product [Gadus morhua 'NCC']
MASEKRAAAGSTKPYRPSCSTLTKPSDGPGGPTAHSLTVTEGRAGPASPPGGAGSSAGIRLPAPRAEQAAEPGSDRQPPGRSGQQSRDQTASTPGGAGSRAVIRPPAPRAERAAEP